MVCRNGEPEALLIHNAQNVTVRRVSAYDAGLSNSVILIWNSSQVTIEDVAAAGSGRSMFLALSSQDVTLRRCWGRYTEGVGENSVIIFNDTANSTIENCVATIAIGSSEVVGLVIAGSTTRASDNNYLLGNIVGANDSGRASVQISGTAIFEGTQILDLVAFDGSGGFVQRADADLFLSGATLVRHSNAALIFDASSPLDPGFTINATIRNALVIGVSPPAMNSAVAVTSDPEIINIDHGFVAWLDVNTPYSGTVAGNNDIDLCNDLFLCTPPFDEQVYGKGAYLIAPDVLAVRGENGTQIGANVLYRYENRLLTGERLWPWPMEERIFAETGLSVTWEAEGGLWKTLDGVYP
ncbi:MAG: hypothetical protein R3C68_02345 [Myxococcota bacterium]